VPLTAVTDRGRTLRLAGRYGSGSEGVVYAVEEPPPGQVAKLLLRPGDAAEAGRRLGSLVRQGRSPRTARLQEGSPPRAAWPVATITVEGRDVSGFVMPDMTRHYRPLDEFLAAPYGQPPFRGTTWATALAAAENLAGLTADLHAACYIAGDMKPGNLWMNQHGNVGISDVDSFQFTEGRETFLCRVRSPGYTAPEGIDTPQPKVTEHSDDFTLAVIVHQLLMAGLHPFHGMPGDGTPYISVDDNILHGRTRIADPSSLRPVRGAPPPSLLPRRLRQLFQECFSERGRREPGSRPTAARWRDALEASRAPGQLRRCETVPRHVFAAERPWCPWCPLGS
jgi:DNA-binding helix-hairpin-helix protein with protein kinase domain